MDKDTLLQFHSKRSNRRSKKHYSDEEKQEYIKRYQESGLSKEAFCRQHQISAAALYRWLSKSKIEVTSPKNPTVTKKLNWTCVTPNTSTENISMLELRFSDTLQMKLPMHTDPVWLSQLMMELHRCKFD